MTAFRQTTATLTAIRGPEVGVVFDIGATTVTIGRYGECDIQVRDTWVSRWHARVSWNGIEYIVEDLGSTNGTYVNGQRIGAPRALRSGDRLQLGEQVEFAFQVGVPVPSGKVAVPAGVRPSPGRRASPSEAMPTFTKLVAEQRGTAHRRQGIGVWVLAALLCLLILTIGGGVYYLLSDGVRATATPTITPTVTPELTLTAKQSYAVKVRDGVLAVAYGLGAIAEIAGNDTWTDMDLKREAIAEEAIATKGLLSELKGMEAPEQLREANDALGQAVRVCEQVLNDLIQWTESGELSYLEQSEKNVDECGDLLNIGVGMIVEAVPTGMPVPTSPPPKQSPFERCVQSDKGVRYVIFRENVDAVSLTWENDTGGTEQGDYLVPYCKTFTGFGSGDFLYISAQIIRPTEWAGSIECRIYDGNSVIAQARASGFASIATCSGSAR